MWFMSAEPVLADPGQRMISPGWTGIRRRPTERAAWLADQEAKIERP
jgi:hypothetical protein